MRTVACAWLLTSMFIVNLSSLPSTVISIAFLIIILLSALCIRRSRPIAVGALLALFSLGAAFLQLASHQLHPEQISKDMTLIVRVASVPEQQERRLAFTASVLTCKSCEHKLHIKTIRLSWYGAYPAVRAGEVWQLSARLKPPASLRNAGGFDAIAWSAVKGLHAKGYVRDAAKARKLADNAGFSQASLRQHAAEQLEVLIDADDEQYLGLLQALAVGLKTRISDEQWDVLRSTGTAHLLAISGLHVGLVAGWALFVGRWFANFCVRCLRRLGNTGLVFDPRPWGLILSLLSAMAYAALAGFELPTQRAVLMLSVWVVASLYFRFLPPMAALCMALIAVLCVNALNLLSAGFWLSFGTVASLFYLHRGHLLHKSDDSSHRWAAIFGKGRALTRTHVLLGIVLLPVSAWFFQSGSFVAPLANLVAVPWVAMVSVPLSLLALVASTASDTLASPLLSLATGSLSILMQFLSLLDQTMLSSVSMTIPGALALALALLALFIAFAPKGLGLRLLVIPLLLPVWLHNTHVPAADGFEVHVLDVGQGLAVLVYSGEHTLLFDTGGKVSPDLSMFEAVVVPFLQASGRRRIDTLVISHGDEDHAFGAGDVVRRFSDVRVFASQLPDLGAVRSMTECVAGRHWSIGNVHFGFVHPAVSDKGNDNNRSCVLMIYMGKSRVLLTGDIEAPAELRLLSRLGDDEHFPVTMLTAPHHGSITSSSQAFVDKLRPDYVVFPAGQRNRYGFPHRDVQLRYKLAGSKSFITGHKGAVSFLFSADGLSRAPISWWDSRRRFWHGIVNPDCWQHFAGSSIVLRLLKLAQKGQTLCGK